MLKGVRAASRALTGLLRPKPTSWEVEHKGLNSFRTVHTSSNTSRSRMQLLNLNRTGVASHGISSTVTNGVYGMVWCLGQLAVRPKPSQRVPRPIICHVSTPHMYYSVYYSAGLA